MNRVPSNDVYGLIGFPLEHSFSKTYFNKKFEQEQIQNCLYLNFPISKIGDFEALIQNQPHLKGLNVTIPYKESILSFIDQLDEEATSVGAINTIKVIRDQDSGIRLIGYNTDIIGFRQTIKSRVSNKITRALILGSGGASKAVNYTLESLKFDTLTVSRKPTKDQISYSQINQEVIDNYKLIVNTTPLGMFPNTSNSPALPYDFIGTDHVLFDLIYNPAETQFLKRGRKKGAQTINGEEMLRLQAEASWEIWRSKQ